MDFKKFTTYVPLIILFIGFIIGIFIKKPTYTVPQGKVLVTQVFLDSLKYIASLPPIVTVKDSIIHDTIKIPQHTDPEPTIDPIDSTLFVYNDSLKNDSIDVSINFKSTGLVKGGINWSYTPILLLKQITIEKPIPYPVIREVPVLAYRTGTYISLAADGNKNMFMIGADLDIVTKNDYIYGIQFRRFGNENIYGGKIGFNLNRIFKYNQ